jgi:Tfp pilus assembly protein FimT
MRPVDCPLCHGRGGTQGPQGWIKCRQCHPRQTRDEAKQAALIRYVTGNQNELAYRHCKRLGFSDQQLAREVESYRQTRDDLGLPQQTLDI